MSKACQPVAARKSLAASDPATKEAAQSAFLAMLKAQSPPKASDKLPLVADRSLEVYLIYTCCNENACKAASLQVQL